MITRAHIRRQLRAKGGIMNVVPRTNYFLGGIKKRLRKLIPNELASVAVKAAPFVAPFNPAVAAAMAGIGGFDKTGRVGSSLKSAALTYGGGQLARQLGGADLQGNPFTEGGAFRGGLEGLKSGFSSPVTSGTKAKLFGSEQADKLDGAKGIFEKLKLTEGAGSLKLTGLGKISAGALTSYFIAKGATPQEAEGLTKDVYRGKGIGFDQIRADLNKYKSGELSQSQMFDKNYRFLTPRNFVGATGGRVGLRSGGDPLPEDPTKPINPFGPKPTGPVLPNKMAEIPKGLSMQDAVKIFKLSNDRNPKNMQELIKFFKNRKLSAMGGIMDMPTGNMRRNRAGVMERDYRDKGGFVPVGVKEKADDVPAMLSKNEFVMTADAVRGAGNGNIKKGAQRMYDLMKQNEGKVA